jgi:hypothetical protein
MPKTKISEFSATPANNTDIDSINIAEGCAPSGINDAIRELMAQLKDFQTGAQGDSFGGPISGAVNATVGATTPNSGSFTTLTSSSSITHTDGTANGVLYLNGSKVVKSGTAIVFDGTNLGVGTSSPSTRLHVYSTSVVGPFIKLQGTTNAVNLQVENTSGSYYLGTDDSVGTSTGAAYGRFVYATGTYPLHFYTNSIKQATIDSVGNLGLGVTPSAWGTNSKGFQVLKGGLWHDNSQYFSLVNNAYYDGTNWKYISTAAASQIAQINGESRFYNAASDTAGNTITFTQAMTLDSGGRLLVGATSNFSGERLFVSGNNASYVVRAWNANASPNGYVISYTGAAPNGTGNEFLACADTSTLRMSVRSNGGIANYSANNVNLSDRREKTNFAPAKSYLDVICAIPVQTYNYIDQSMEEDGGLNLGVIAQDVQAVAPELVTESDWSDKKDGSKMRLSIYQTDLQYALMKCIQELKAEFDAYKASHP